MREEFKRKPAGPKPPKPDRLSPKETEKIYKEQIKKGIKPKSNMPMLKRGGRAR